MNLPSQISQTQATGNMRLYKYRNLTNAWNILDIIANERLYLSPLDSLNDPMEIKTEQAKAVIRTYLSEKIYDRSPTESEISFAKNQGLTVSEYDGASLGELMLGLQTQSFSRICSLSEDARSATMWSHYADGHQGICFEFELNSALPVVYWSAEKINNRFSASYMMRLFARLNSGSTSSMMRSVYMYEKLKKLYCIKQRDWAYEREWRLFGYGRSFYVLRDGECLTRVLVGQRISAFHYEILRKLLPSHIPLVKTKIVSGKVIEAS